jgi:F0F1-type ATP synthase delta subunit
VKITIKTAHELAGDMKESITKFLADKVKMIVESSFLVDPDVIGGFIAESDNFIVDSSVKRSLEQFRLSLIKM